MTLQPGTQLGHYEITSLLGSGGMGEVYRATDHKLGRDVAIKVLREELASDPERLRRFEQEARSASALNHPNIITIYDIGKHESTPYIAMEFVEGKTLREMLCDGPLPTKKLLQLATQIAEGLAKAHSAGIIHRDLKPENLMVTSDGYVKILDFGLAKLMPEAVDYGSEEATVTRELTRAGVILGTVGYMSPEQASGQPLDHRSDQFSFGSILYEMATGEIAFKRETAAQMLVAIIEGEPEPLAKVNPNVPPHLRVIVELCLTKEPGERYGSTGDLARELKTVPETPSAWRARRKFLWAAAGLLVALLAVALGPNLIRLWDQISSRAGPAPIESIAVLPLQNLSGDPEQEYFTDGMTEALITDLAKIGALKVISRSSAMRYKGTDKPLAEIARELNVDAVVEGSALRVDGSVRIMAQLIDPETEQALWAESYERDLENVLLLWSEVAQAIAGEVRVALTPEETKRLANVRTVDPEAYEAFLKATNYRQSLTASGYEAAERYYTLALEKDPTYAAAWAGLARVWTGRQQLGITPAKDATPKARAAVLKALTLDETDWEAHRALAGILTWGDWDWPAAERKWKQLIELSPDHPEALQGYSHFLMHMGRQDEAMAQIERALQLDSFSVRNQGFYAIDLVYARRYDDAIAAARAALRIQPDAGVAGAALYEALLMKGLRDEALALDKETFADDRELMVALEQGEAEAGYAGAQRRLAQLWTARFGKPGGVVPYVLARRWLYAGDENRALEWLERAYEARDPNMPYLGMPIYDSLHSDPRFQDLLRRMNLPE